MSSAAYRLPSSHDTTDLQEVVAEISSKAGPLPQITLDYDSTASLLWITLRPEPKPVFTLPLIESVGRVQDAVLDIWGESAERPIKYLAYRAAGKVFSLGGDLDYYLDCLRSNDHRGLRNYADKATAVIRGNREGLRGTVITLSNVHAKAIGGGIDPARACNVMIAEEGATFSYPEVDFNHFPISAVPVLSRHTGPIEAERILLSGDEYTAQEFRQKGAVDAVVPAGTGDGWITAYARRTLASHGARIALMRAFNAQHRAQGGSLDTCAEAWASHIMHLKPSEVSKLQRIAAAQERMLTRMYR